MKNLFSNAEFENKICGLEYAKFDKSYITEVKNYSKTHNGKLSTFLHSVLMTYGCSHNNKGKIFLNKYSVDFVLRQISYFKKHQKWETV